MYTVVRQPKSVGIALLLTFLFGPIGLFYATVTGGLVMTLGPLVLLIFFMVTIQSSVAILAFLASMLVYALLGWLVCLVWAIFAVNAYNRKLIMGALMGTVLKNTAGMVTALPYTDEETSAYPDSADLAYPEKKPNRAVGLVIIALLGVIGYLLYDKYRSTPEHLTGWTLRSDAPVYASSNIKSAIISELKAGVPVEVVGETIYFAKVKWEEKSGTTRYGFVRKSLLNHHPPATMASLASQEARPDPAAAVGMSLAESLKWRETRQTPVHDEAVVTEEAGDESLLETAPAFWRVTSARAYFHDRTSTNTQRTGYLVNGNVFTSRMSSDHFIYAEFTNKQGKRSAGYILRDDVVAEDNHVMVSDSIR